MTDATTRRPTRWRRVASGIRVRLVAWFALLLALASGASILVVRQALLTGVDERIDLHLAQEVQEVRSLADGNDPLTGRPFGTDVEAILRTFLRRNIPARNETYVTFVDGRPFLRSEARVPYRLDRDEVLVRRWRDLTTSDRGVAHTPAGVVEFLAVPLHEGGRTRAVFVVAFFRDLERREIQPAVAGVGATGAVVLVFGVALAWRLAGRILRPVREVRGTALAISESDLSRRIDVAGRDEIADLAATFNGMLDRIEEAFATQKMFIDDASHELRTPLTIVRGHLETLDENPDEQRQTLALVLDEVERMTRLVDDLLLLARARRPDFLRLEVTDVATLTESVHAKATAIAPRSWTLDAVGTGRVVADPQRLTQALVALAENASKHTLAGDTVAIGSRVSDGHVEFWVRDSGPGIAPHQQERIFERASRGTSTAQDEGLGLGLAIVRAIAQAHHGEVEIDSQLGRGSTFRLVLPVDQPHRPREWRTR